MSPKIYEQVATQLRDQILRGELATGERLPNETTLATNFSVSRATVREALRLLAAQSLIRTAKGATGGSYVTVPTAGHISESLGTGIGLLTAVQNVSLDELLETRELLEVPAAELAARRWRARDVERLQAAIPETLLRLDTNDQFAFNRDFHSLVIETARNTLLSIAAQPIFRVLQTHLVRSSLSRKWHREINLHHQGIAGAIEARDERRARELMYDHLEFLRPYYEKAWREAARMRGSA